MSKSKSGTKKSLHRLLNDLRSSIQSMSTFLILDTWSTSISSVPLIYSAAKVMFLNNGPLKNWTIVNDEKMVLAHRSTQAMTIVLSDHYLKSA